MVAILPPSEDECYLLAILEDTTGIDQAEFLWVDEESEDGCYRLWSFQWPWQVSDEPLQVDSCGRAVGKSVGIQMRAFAFPFAFPGQEMLITAPELNHLRPVVDKVEARLMASRLAREMLPRTKGRGISRQPQWQARFANGASILSRLPQRDGKGVKGSVSPDALVLTSEGHKRAGDIRVGDLVYTDMQRWRPVIDVAHSSDVDLVEVDGGGYRGMVMSWNHRMIGRRNRNPQKRVSLEPWQPVSVDVDEVPERWYFGSPMKFPPAQPQLPDACRDGVALLALAGWYVAEGSQGTSGSVALTVHESEVATIEALASRLGLACSARRKHGLAWTVRVGGGIGRWLREHFGQHANGKRLPVWLLGADEPFRWAFLDGYLAGDGHHDVREGKANRWMAGTASRELAVGLRLLAQTLGYAASMSYVDPKVKNIVGADLTSTPQRSWRVTVRESKRNVVEENGWAWQKVRSVRDLPEKGDVVTIAVADDHSFVADGLLHHNIHSTIIEMDEAQDYPLAGWVEIIESRNRWSKGSMFRCHGVARGVRDKFFEISQDNSGWKVHRMMAMMRPGWSDEERQEKINQYGGSRNNPDYRRNIYGEHGDATNPVFVLARLMACVDQNEGSEYNAEVFTTVRIIAEQLESERNPSGRPLESFLDEIPGSHLVGWSGAPKGYGAYYGGMDIGLTNHPSEILIFGERHDAKIDLLLRIHMQRIQEGEQRAVVRHLFHLYGSKLKAFGLDRGGVGFPIFQSLQRELGDRLVGWTFDEKVVVGYEDRELERGETQEDLAIYRPMVEHATDVLRNEYVDPKRLLLPFDREVLSEWQGQSYTVVKSAGSPYGKRSYSQGGFHCLDAAKVAMAAKTLPQIQAMLHQRTAPTPILDTFMGAM